MTDVGRVYGKALYDLCRSEGIVEDGLKQLSILEQCFRAEPGYIRLLSSPALSKAERCHVLEDSFRGSVQPYLLNFLKILTEKSYMQHFPDCCATYRACFNRDHNILPVNATTAAPMTPEQLRRLTEKLSAITGKNVVLQNKLDPTVMGGVRLDCDGKRLDGTIAARLEDIHHLLKDTVL